MLYKSGEKKSLQIKDVGYEYANSLGCDGLRLASNEILLLLARSHPFRKHTPNKTLRFVFTASRIC